MKCDRCGASEVAYIVKETINGVTTTKQYCSKCMPTQSEIDLPFSSFFKAANDFLWLEEEKPKAKPVAPCPTCHLTYENLIKGGRFGCSQCYKHFSELIPYYLDKMQDGRKHIGKSYLSRELDEVELKQRQLKEELNQAILAEDYERAAKIRDSLKGLKGEA